MTVRLCQKCYDAVRAIHGEQEVYTGGTAGLWRCDFGDGQARYLLPISPAVWTGEKKESRE
jgi:hypothetical protein